MAASLADAMSFGLVGGADGERFERFVVLDALVYPYASWDGLRAAGGFNQWLFFLDDQYDDDPIVASDPERVRDLVGRAFEVLSTGKLPWDARPFDRLTVEVRRRIRSACTGVFWSRFLDDVHAYLFEGSLVALRTWRERRVLAPTTYRMVRRRDSGMACVIDLSELAAGEELSGEVLARPEVRTLRDACADHVAFLNDLVSYHKEVVRAGSPFNLVHSVATHETRGDLPAAIRKVVAELDGLVGTFEAAAARASGPGQRHAAALRHWIAGNHRFSFRSGRYHHPEAHLDELRRDPYATPAPALQRAARPQR